MEALEKVIPRSAQSHKRDHLKGILWETEGAEEAIAGKGGQEGGRGEARTTSKKIDKAAGRRTMGLKVAPASMCNSESSVSASCQQRDTHFPT